MFRRKKAVFPPQSVVCEVIRTDSVLFEPWQGKPLTVSGRPSDLAASGRRRPFGGM